MRDNAKGGALTEVTFFILLSSILKNMDMLSCNLLKIVQRAAHAGGRYFIWCVELVAEKGWIAPLEIVQDGKKEYLITTQGKEIAEKELIRLNELVGVANGIIGGAV